MKTSFEHTEELNLLSLALISIAWQGGCFGASMYAAYPLLFLFLTQPFVTDTSSGIKALSKAWVGQTTKSCS